MARDDTTTYIIGGLFVYYLYKSGAFANLLGGGSGGTGGGGGGTGGGTGGGGGLTWSVANLGWQAADPATLSSGSPCNAGISFSYSGPGGGINYGFFTKRAGCNEFLGLYSCCDQTYANSASLSAASSATDVTILTGGQFWQGCGFGPYDVQPFVQLLSNGAIWRGPWIGAAITDLG